MSLIDCIRDLLRYDPSKRLTSRQCLVHAYLQETLPRNNIPFPSGLQPPPPQPYAPHISSTTSYVNGSHSHPSLVSPPHTIPLSHSHSAQNLHHSQQYPNTPITHHIPYSTPAPHLCQCTGSSLDAPSRFQPSCKDKFNSVPMSS